MLFETHSITVQHELPKMFAATAFYFFAVIIVATATAFTAEQEAYFKAHNIKTKVSDFTPLDRYLHEVFYPDINLREIAALENRVPYNYSVKSGLLTSHLIDFPQLALQLATVGRELQYPNYRYEHGYYSCVFGICGGYHDVYDIVNGMIHNIVPASTTGGITNGTIFWLKFHGGHAELRCPECTHEHTDLRENPPYDSDTYLKRNLTMIVKNITVLTTFEMGMNTAGLQMDKLDITLVMEEIKSIYQNATHTSPDGTQEEQGEQFKYYGEDFLEMWNYEEAQNEKMLQETMNCYFAGGVGGQNCEYYYNDPFNNQALGQIVHGFGLIALTNGEHDNDSIGNCLADILPTELVETDEIKFFNKFFFRYGTQVVQTGRLIGEFFDRWQISPDSSYPLPFRVQFNCVKNVCTSDGSTCEVIQDELGVGNEPQDMNATAVHGVDGNRAWVAFKRNHFEYMFTAQHLRFLGSDFTRIITNLNTTARDHFNGIELGILNTSAVISSNFDYVNGHFVVSNLTVRLDPGKMYMRIADVLHYDNGDWTEMPALEKDIAPYLKELWTKIDGNGCQLKKDAHWTLPNCV